MNKKSVVTIGTFDGVHKGHRLLIDKTLSLAVKNKLKSIVVLLEKPVKIVKGLLTTCDEKLQEIKTLGVDEIVVINVHSKILTYGPDKFFDKFLLEKLNISEIVCGPDFAFGKDRKGNISWLERKAKNNNIKVNIVKYLGSSKQTSSSYIRTLLEKGDIKNATKLLGRSYSFSGIPFKDKGFGKKLGFPTINLKIDSDKLIPTGVYVSLVAQKGSRTYASVTSIGNRPTFERGANIVPETHILNFDGIWKKASTKIILLKKIRNEKKFKNIQALKTQISEDIAKSSRFFKFGKKC